MAYNVRVEPIENDYNYRNRLVITDASGERDHWDGGEPEDNSFNRDWSWVADELHNAYMQGVNERDQLLAEVARLRKVLVQMAIPYEALLMDAESRKWIAPTVWSAIEAAVTAARAALSSEKVPNVDSETE